MSKRVLGTAAACCLVVLTAASAAHAQEAGANAGGTPPQEGAGAEDDAAPGKGKDEKKEIVRTGVIANIGTYTESKGISVDTAGASPGDEATVITGSVNISGSSACTASVTNASKDNTYSVRFTVVGKNDSGLTTVNKPFSATLRPEQTVQKEFRCDPDDNMAVVLRSAEKR